MRFKLILASVAFALATAIHAAPASAAVCTQQTVWTNSELMTPALLNADPVYLYGTCLQNLDNTNIGSAGIYPSQIIPTNGSQATFGGSSTLTWTFPGAVLLAPPYANNYPYGKLSVVGNDTSTYTTPSGEFEGEYNPAIIASITQSNTGIPTGVMGVVSSAYGSNSATVGSDSFLTGGQFYGVLNSGSNNSQVAGAYVQSVDNSSSTGHPTAKGDASQAAVVASAVNNSQDPSSSTLGYCGTADCLQGMPRSAVAGTSNGAYPIVSNFRASFTSATGGGSANKGNRAYVGFLSNDAISADFEACDAQNIKNAFNGHCIATYGFLSNRQGVATSGATDYGSTVTGYFGSHWTGTTAATDIVTQALYYNATGVNPPLEFRTTVDGFPNEGSFDNGEHEFAGNDSGTSLTNRLAEVSANSPYTYQTVINENAAGSEESDEINVIPTNITSASSIGKAFYQFGGGVLTMLGNITRDGAAHFSNTPITYINGTSVGDLPIHTEIFKNVSVGTANVTMTFGTPYSTAPACMLGPYNTGIKLVGPPSTTGVTVVASTASSNTDIRCDNTP